MKNQIKEYGESKDLFKRELEENSAWLNGTPSVLEYFFKVDYILFKGEINSRVKSYEKDENFWSRVGGSVPRIHSGLPALISRTWVRMLKPRNISITLENDTVNQPRLDAILKENDFTSLLNKGIMTESWAGYLFYKLSIDTEISQYPLIELVDPRNVRVVLKRKRIQRITFVTERKIGEDDYIILEHNDINKGQSKISYECYKGKEDKDTQVTLAEYKSADISVPFFLGFLKNNTSFNSKFTESIFGESDYANVQSLFQMLDSILSNTELDIDNSKAIKFVSDSLVKKNEAGTQEKFDNNETVIIMPHSKQEDEMFDMKKLITLLQPEVRVDQFNKTAKEITGRILANVSLSPATIGLAGFDSVDAAADSQRARKETSIVARNEKADGWSTFLENFLPKLLQLDDVMNNKAMGEYKVNVEFDKYATPNFEDIVDTVVKAVQGGVMSVKQAVEKLYEELTPEEVKQVILDIKGERSIPFLAEEVEDEVDNKVGDIE